jgi:hypothetical protein
MAKRDESCGFTMFISNLSSDKITHVHIYATTILCVIFWIKSNIKISKFLTICHLILYSTLVAKPILYK